MQPQQVLPPPASGEAVARVVGALLVLPALVLTVLTLVVPTVGTVGASTRAGTLLDTDAEFVGMENFIALFGETDWWSSVGFALSLVVVPILVAVVVAPLVAAALDWAGGWARLTGRVVLSLTLVVFSPVALALAWQREYRDDPTRLGDPELAGGVVRGAVGMMTFGVVCAVGVMIFLPVFRAREQRRPLWPALFTTAGVAVLGLLAIGLQLFTVPLVMTNFGPKDETTTPVGVLFTNAFRLMRTGMGAAAATVLLVLLAILGVAAVLVVILTRLRVSLLPSRNAPRREPGAVVLAALVLAAIVVAIVLNTLPWFDSLSGSTPDGPSGTAGRTWLPALTGALVAVGVAYLAALGISGLRPLGRHSEWLLMPFAPWLFVGAGVLSVEFFTSARESGSLDTEGALQPPIMVSILSLVILAVLCRGQSERWRHEVTAGAPQGVAFLRTVVVPTLPLAGFLFVVATLLNAQDLLWPLLVSASLENATTPLTLFMAGGDFSAPDYSVASATPVLAVVLFGLVVAAAQAFHLDRMVTATGPDEPR